MAPRLYGTSFQLSSGQALVFPTDSVVRSGSGGGNLALYGITGIFQNYAGQLRLSSRPHRDFIDEQLRGLPIRTQHLLPLWHRAISVSEHRG